MVLTKINWVWSIAKLGEDNSSNLLNLQFGFSLLLNLSLTIYQIYNALNST
jgi:hypothetical protein